MPRLIVRAIGCLLIPCLVVDPTAAGGFCYSGVIQAQPSRVAGRILSEQAIVAHLIGAFRKPVDPQAVGLCHLASHPDPDSPAPTRTPKNVGKGVTYSAGDPLRQISAIAAVPHPERSANIGRLKQALELPETDVEEAYDAMVADIAWRSHNNLLPEGHWVTLLFMKSREWDHEVLNPLYYDIAQRRASIKIRFSRHDLVVRKKGYLAKRYRLVLENGDYQSMKVLIPNRNGVIKKDLETFIQETAGMALEKPLSEIMNMLEVGGVGIQPSGENQLKLYRHDFHSIAILGSEGQVQTVGVESETTARSDPAISPRIIRPYGRLAYGYHFHPFSSEPSSTDKIFIKLRSKNFGRIIPEIIWHEEEDGRLKGYIYMPIERKQIYPDRPAFTGFFLRFSGWFTGLGGILTATATYSILGSTISSMVVGTIVAIFVYKKAAFLRMKYPAPGDYFFIEKYYNRIVMSVTLEDKPAVADPDVQARPIVEKDPVKKSHFFLRAAALSKAWIGAWHRLWADAKAAGVVQEVKQDFDVELLGWEHAPLEYLEDARDLLGQWPVSMRQSIKRIKFVPIYKSLGFWLAGMGGHVRPGSGQANVVLLPHRGAFQFVLQHELTHVVLENQTQVSANLAANSWREISVQDTGRVTLLKLEGIVAFALGGFFLKQVLLSVWPEISLPVLSFALGVGLAVGVEISMRSGGIADSIFRLMTRGTAVVFDARKPWSVLTFYSLVNPTEAEADLVAAYSLFPKKMQEKRSQTQNTEIIQQQVFAGRTPQGTTRAFRHFSKVQFIAGSILLHAFGLALLFPSGWYGWVVFRLMNVIVVGSVLTAIFAWGMRPMLSLNINLPSEFQRFPESVKRLTRQVLASTVYVFHESMRFALVVMPLVMYMFIRSPILGDKSQSIDQDPWPFPYAKVTPIARTMPITLTMPYLGSPGPSMTQEPSKIYSLTWTKKYTYRKLKNTKPMYDIIRPLELNRISDFTDLNTQGELKGLVDLMPYNELKVYIYAPEATRILVNLAKPATGWSLAVDVVQAQAALRPGYQVISLPFDWSQIDWARYGQSDELKSRVKNTNTYIYIGGLDNKVPFEVKRIEILPKPESQVGEGPTSNSARSPLMIGVLAFVWTALTHPQMNMTSPVEWLIAAGVVITLALSYKKIRPILAAA